MMALSDMAGRLARQVRPQDDFPTPEQYEDAVRDAVHAFNELYGVKSVYTFPTVSGQAEYSLPDNFSRLIQLEKLTAMGDVMVVAEGLIPLPFTAMTEQALVNGRTLTIFPTPAYSTTRRVWYRAVHVLDENETYPAMEPDVASLIAIKAQANAWRIICGHVSRSQGWKYQQGDVMIDKTKVADSLSGWVNALDVEFERRVVRRIGTIGGLAAC
jgi:hypothetical protein